MKAKNFQKGETSCEKEFFSFFTLGVNHLGNVLQVVTDRKLAHDNGVYNPETGGYYTMILGGDGVVDYYVSDVVSQSDYYPFGMLLPGRNSSEDEYRYGFQNQETDDEIKGEGNSVNFKYRMHDPRVGRFFAVDPLAWKYPFWSPYAFSGNQVIHSVEIEGLETEMNLNYGEATLTLHKENGVWVMTEADQKKAIEMEILELRSGQEDLNLGGEVEVDFKTVVTEGSIVQYSDGSIEDHSYQKNVSLTSTLLLPENDVISIMPGNFTTGAYLERTLGDGTTQRLTADEYNTPALKQRALNKAFKNIETLEKKIKSDHPNSTITCIHINVNGIFVSEAELEEYSIQVAQMNVGSNIQITIGYGPTNEEGLFNTAICYEYDVIEPAIIIK